MGGLEDGLEGVDPAIREQIISARQRLIDEQGAGIDLTLPDGPAFDIEDTGDDRNIVFPRPTDEQFASRAELTREMLKLDENFKQEGLDSAYMLAGPLWLYLSSTEGRDFILGLPEDTRRVMVRDVMETSPLRAHDFARDILMVRDAESQTSTQDITQTAIEDGAVAHGG